VNVYPFIEAEKQGRRNVKRACELLKVSRAAFYAHRAGPSRRGQDDAQLASEIRAVHEESRGRYGAPRVHAELRRRGHRHGPQAGRPADALHRPAGPGGERWKKTTKVRIQDDQAGRRALKGGTGRLWSCGWPS
jgi:transposase InsO family protein